MSPQTATVVFAIGILGLFLLDRDRKSRVFLVMAWGYRNVVGSLRQDPELGRLKLVYFVVGVVYNLTEAAFRAMHPIWIVFLLAITVVHNRPEAGFAGVMPRGRSLRFRREFDEQITGRDVLT